MKDREPRLSGASPPGYTRLPNSRLRQLKSTRLQGGSERKTPSNRHYGALAWSLLLNRPGALVPPHAAPQSERGHSVTAQHPHTASLLAGMLHDLFV